MKTISFFYIEMESNTHCTRCKAFKASSEFISYGAKGGSKQLKTCNNCRQRFQKSDKKRKRYVEKNDSQPSTLDIVDIDFFNEVITNLLENTFYNQEFHLHCQVSNNSYENSTNELSTKELANKIIELIEDADGYHWNYNHLYEGKDNITYWYFCSQRDILASKPRKHPDLSKQRDIPSMERFACNGIIKISIDKTTQISEVDLHHKYRIVPKLSTPFLHVMPAKLTIT